MRAETVHPNTKNQKFGWEGKAREVVDLGISSPTIRVTSCRVGWGDCSRSGRINNKHNTQALV